MGGTDSSRQPGSLTRRRLVVPCDVFWLEYDPHLNFGNPKQEQIHDSAPVAIPRASIWEPCAEDAATPPPLSFFWTGSHRLDYNSHMPHDWQARIESDPLVLRGKPCIRGTRIPVGLILGYLASGKTIPQVIDDFPDVTAADIAASLEYARDLADFEAVTIPS